MVQSIDLNFGIDRILMPNFSTRKSLSPSTEPKRVKISVKEITKRQKRGVSSPTERKRITFTIYQLAQMEEVFSTNQYVHGAERVLLAKRLGLEPINVKNWFQNRRIRFRRKQNSISTSDSDN